MTFEGRLLFHYSMDLVWLIYKFRRSALLSLSKVVVLSLKLSLFEPAILTV